MEKKLGLKVISSAALAGLLFTAAPVMQADAATNNYSTTVPKIQDDKGGQALGTVVINEDEDSDGFLKDGNVITVTLPNGVEYDNIKTDLKVGDRSDGAKAATVAQYVYTNDTNVNLIVKAVTKNYLTVEVENDSDTDESKLYFYFGEKTQSTVKVDSDFEGDVKVEIDADGTPITSEFVTVARVLGGETTTTVSDVEDLAIDKATEIGTIKIAENRTGVFDKNGGNIEVKLPNDYKWDNTTGANKIDVTSVGVSVYSVSYSNDKDTMYIELDGDTVGDTQPGFITISNAKVYVPDDADNGDEVEVTVDGNEATKEDILIGTVGDFGISVEVEGDIETIIAGQSDQEVAEIVLDELVSDSWIDGRTVRLELPSWAEWYGYDDNGNGELDDDEDGSVTGSGALKNGSINDDLNEIKFTVDASGGKAELDNLAVKLDADAPEGDLVVKISGSAGVEEEVVVAKVQPPFKVTAEKPEFVIGVNNQELGDIVLTETVDEAIEEGKWIVVKAPNGMFFADTPTVKVTDGDIEIDDEDTDDEYFAFKVTGESAKQAAEITISDIQMNLDRTVPVGDITFEVFMTNNDNNKTLKFKDAIESDNYDEVMDVVVGTVVTPAPDQSGSSVVMNLGSTLYTVNGATKVMDVAPQVIEGRTFTPVRYVAESLGAEVAYDDATKTATLTKGETVVEFVLGSKTYTVNGAAQTMDVAAQAINGRTMLPARYVAEAFGYAVGFDPATKTVVISE